MPLRNRVDPFGHVHAVAARGLMTGNRGVIHDPTTRMLLKRRFTTRAWIICACDFKDRRRDVMGRNAPSGNAGWTELFFLDEVTALAAGHRPCFTCRRDRAVTFRQCFSDGHGERSMSAPRMDAVLHGQRGLSAGTVTTLPPRAADALPDGAMVAVDGEPFGRRGSTWLRWSFDGWQVRESLPRAVEAIVLLTPDATCRALAHGYAPIWHGSAGP